MKCWMELLVVRACTHCWMCGCPLSIKYRRLLFFLFSLSRANSWGADTTRGLVWWRKGQVKQSGGATYSHCSTEHKTTAGQPPAHHIVVDRNVVDRNVQERRGGYSRLIILKGKCTRINSSGLNSKLLQPKYRFNNRHQKVLSCEEMAALKAYTLF